MIKVVIDGQSGPYIENGNSFTEDEQYLYLKSDGIKTRIPLNRVIKVEDLGEAVHHLKNIDNKENPSTVNTKPDRQRKITVNDLQQAMKNKSEAPIKLPKKLNEHRSNNDVEERVVDVNVVVTGGDQRTFNLQVPASAISNDRYTTGLQKAIANSGEMKSIWEKGIIFDGVPKVSGHTVYVKTRDRSDSLNDIGNKMDLMSKVNNLGNKFQKPDKDYQVDFGMANGNDFSISGSPFEKPVSLESSTEKDSDRENTAEKETD